MLIDLDDIKQEFTRIKTENFGSQEMMDFVVHIWENYDLSPDDAGWVLWNICDQYALGRANDPITQYRYQSEFYELVKLNFPERAHWVVSDATQGLSLLRGGFEDFWCKCYQYSNEKSPCVAGNRRVRFEAHRTYAEIFKLFGKLEYMRSALNAMSSLLDEDDNWSGREFGIATHKTQLYELYTLTGEIDKAEEIGQTIERILCDWLQRTGDGTIVRLENEPLFGSWQSFCVDIPLVSGCSVVINNAACVFARTRRFPAAERMFRTWMNYRNRPLNEYGEALFLLSCWHNGHSKEEIRRMFNESKTNSSISYVIYIAPELADVIC